MNACEYLSNKRVNIELILFRNDNNVQHFGIRVRPWKQDGRRPMMILVQGLTLDDAMNNAARGYHLDKWIELDWSARPWHLVQPKEVDDYEEPVLEFMPMTTDGSGFASEALQAPPALITGPRTRKQAVSSV